MRALLFVVGLVLAAAGVAIGAMSYYSPGEVILGLNLGLAATLLVGGLIVTALSSLIGAVNDLADSMMPAAPSPMIRDIVRSEPEAGSAAIAAVGGAAVAAAGAAGAAATEIGAVASENATSVVSSASDALTRENDAVETVKADVRKTLGIDEVQIEQTDAGSTSVSRNFAESTEAAVEDASDTVTEDAIETNSVAARIGAITAGVKAAAETADDKFSEVTEASQDTTESATETLDAVFEAPEDEVAQTLETTEDTVEDVAEASADGIEAEAVTETEAAVELAEETAGDTVEEATGTASEAIDLAAATEETVVETVEEMEEAAGDDVDEVVPEAEPAVTSAPQELSAQASESETVPEAEPEAAAPADSALYVVEETTVRERPARMLSDGTVEAETDAGWMRFENMDHLNEYLDAMSA